MRIRSRILNKLSWFFPFFILKGNHSFFRQTFSVKKKFFFFFLLICLLGTSCRPIFEQQTAMSPAQDSLRQFSDWTAAIVEGTGSVSASSFALIESVEVYEHDDFDRLVLEFSNRGLPAYHIEYIDTPVRLCGSGKPLFLPGEGWLSIRLRPARMHVGGESSVAGRGRALSLPGILEIVTLCDFENNVEWVAAVSSPNRYRVAEFTSPPRLVIDVRH